jgi:hypothetical protein
MNYTNQLKPLPLNISSFNKLHDYNMIYVDKTHFIYPLVSMPGQYFLSRPRRFGKSLLVSLLKHLFLGHKDYFKGLWIDNHWHYSPAPVLVFDFNEISHMTPMELEKGLFDALDIMAENYHVTLSKTMLKERLTELIRKISTQHGKVNVLVDEYDKPIIDHLGLDENRFHIAKENRSILKKFFGTFKGASIAELVPFLFITGVSKFSHVSVFSDLNNLTDLTMNPQFATLLGYTVEEITQNFHLWIEKWAINQGLTETIIYQRLKDHYDGFRFSSAPMNVYNPISILNALQFQQLKNYWFETATPTFLIHLLDKKNVLIPKIETTTLQEKHFSSYDLENLNPTALMFQTGYITIKDAQKHHDTTIYRFDFPNIEVKQSFLELLLIKYGRLSQEDYISDTFELYHDFYNHRFGIVIQTIQNVLQGIPHLENQTHEWFHQFFYMMIQSACPYTRTINIANKMVIMIESDKTIIFTAFSCSHSVNELMQCLNQESEVNYLKDSDKDLYLMAIHLDHQNRVIDDWTCEHVNIEPVVIPDDQKTTVKIIKLFLSCSSDLKTERKEIGLWMNRKNKGLIKKNQFIELVVWEDLLQSFQGQRIQDYFNQEMLACDIVVVLFYSKVGQFTKEEFELAYANMKAGKMPRYLFVGFKDAQISTKNITNETFEIIQLREQIKQNEQLYFIFESIDQLILKLDAQIEICIKEFSENKFPI